MAWEMKGIAYLDLASIEISSEIKNDWICCVYYGNCMTMHMCVHVIGPKWLTNRRNILWSLMQLAIFTGWITILMMLVLWAINCFKINYKFSLWSRPSLSFSLSLALALCLLSFHMYFWMMMMISARSSIHSRIGDKYRERSPPNFKMQRSQSARVCMCPAYMAWKQKHTQHDVTKIREEAQELEVYNILSPSIQHYADNYTA